MWLFDFLLLFWQLFLIELSLIEYYGLFIFYFGSSPLSLFLLLILFIYDDKWAIRIIFFFGLFWFPFLLIFAYLPVLSSFHLPQWLIHLDLLDLIYVIGVKIGFFIDINQLYLQLYLITYEFKLSLYSYFNSGSLKFQFCAFFVSLLQIFYQFDSLGLIVATFFIVFKKGGIRFHECFI